MPSPKPFDLSISAEDFIDQATAARMLGFSMRQMQRLRAARSGPPVIRIRRKLFFHRPSILTWLLSQQQENLGPEPRRRYGPRKPQPVVPPAHLLPPEQVAALKADVASGKVKRWLAAHYGITLHELHRYVAGHYDALAEEAAEPCPQQEVVSA